MKLLRTGVAGVLIAALIISLPLSAAAADESAPLTDDNPITVVNNAADTFDSIAVGGLVTGDIITVYSDAELSSSLGTATVSSTGIAKLTMAQLTPNDAAGVVYVTVTQTDLDESTAYEVAVPEAGVSVYTSPSNTIIVTNSSSGTGDTVIVSGLQSGDKIKVYADPELTSVLGNASAGTTGTATVKIQQLSAGDIGDTVYVTITRPTNLESPSIPITVPSAGVTAPLTNSNVVSIVENAAGISDSITFEGLSQGDKVRVYADAELTAVLGFATAPVSGTAVVTVPQLVANDVNGSVFATVTRPGKHESGYLEIIIPAAGTTPELSLSVITVTNNAAGISDTVVVTGLTQGDKIRIYSDEDRIHLLGFSIASSSGTCTVTIPQLIADDDEGNIYVTATTPGKLESDTVTVPVTAGDLTPELSSSNTVTVTNNAGSSDTLVVTGLKKGDKIRIYSDDQCRNLIGNAVAGVTGTASATVAQLIAGDVSGYVYVTVTTPSKLESKAASVSVPAAKSTAPLSTANTVTIVNNAVGTNDTVTVTGLAKGDKVKVYTDLAMTTQLGTATATGTGPVTISIPQITPGDAAGEIYITVTNALATESSPATYTVPSARTTAALTSANNIVVKNNALGTSDTIVITRLSQGDKIRVYADENLTMPLGTATASAAGSVTVTVPQLILGDGSGTVYITVTNAAALESAAVSAAVPAAGSTPALFSVNTVTIVNNIAGTNDTIVITGLSQGDKVKVFSDVNLTNQIANAVAVASGIATIKVAQLLPNDASGTVYITVTTPGKNESTAESYAVPPVGTTQPLSGFNTTMVTNNASGTNDTVVVDRLTQGDKVRIYADDNLTVLLGFATASASGPVIVSVPQLTQKDAAGTVYITLTNAGKYESAATSVQVPGCSRSFPLSSGNPVRIENNPVGTSDTVTVGGLFQGDKVKVYSDSQLTNLLGMGSAAATGVASFKVTQLIPNDGPGAVYITISSPAQQESVPVGVIVSAARKTAQLSGFSTVTVTNNVGASDTLLITMLAQGDKIRVYADDKLVKLLGSGTAQATGTVTVSIAQLTPNNAPGYVYITVTNVGALESNAVPVEVPAARATAPVSSFSTVTVTNNVAGISDKIVINLLSKGDKVKVYADARLTALLGTAAADATGTASVTVAQLTPGDVEGTVYVTITNTGAQQSAYTAVTVPAAQKSAGLTDANTITVTNNAAGTKDTVVVSGLAAGDRIRVYSDAKLTSLLGTAVASSTGLAAVLVPQLTPNDGDGAVYITVTHVGAKESAYVSATVTAVARTSPVSADKVTVTNNAAGKSDTVVVTELIQGVRVKVYSDATMMNLIGTTVTPVSGTAVVTVPQLTARDAVGNVYLTVTSPGQKESVYLQLTVPAAVPTAPLTSASAITVTNNAAGTSDTVAVSGLASGVRIKVYSDVKMTNLLGTAVANVSGTATVKVVQLISGDVTGFVYVTVTIPGKLESSPLQVTVPPAPVTKPIK